MQTDLFGAAPAQQQIKKYVGYSDGACKGNPGPGGWGFLLQDDAKNLLGEASGGDRHTTNNKMEMTAAIELLKRIPEGSIIDVFTDSQYVIKGLTEWMRGWKAKNWINSKKEPVANKDLWLVLDALFQKRKVTLHWVRGHNGDPGNERADALANRGVVETLAA